MNKVFLTTAIPYVNAKPHIGFAWELIQADALVRHYRDKLGSENVFFLNGTDEHGSKIQKSAAAENIEPQEFVDRIARHFIDLGRELNISNDDFVRTSSARHKKSASELWKLCSKDIYKKSYEGLYCSGCEEFKTEKDLREGKCPVHGVEVESIKEENYFFALSKYAGQIEKLIREDKLKIIPELRKNEVLGWLKDGVEDVSISREKKKLGWGIPVPGDDEQVMYVWVDALSNYLTGAGFPESKYQDWWNEETLKIHIIGKDILRFHALIWPGLLLSAGLPLPNIIYAHGFITADNQKMSKSLGNVIDPKDIVEKYGVDALRYYLLAKIPWDSDGDFGWEKFRLVYKGELADNWGNLVGRVITLAKKLKIPFRSSDSDERSTLDAGRLIEEFKFNLYIEGLMRELAEINKAINETKPWELIVSDSEAAKKLISNWLKKVYNISYLLAPVAPETFKKVEKICETGDLEQLFPRVE